MEYRRAFQFEPAILAKQLFHASSQILSGNFELAGTFLQPRIATARQLLRAGAAYP